MLISFVITQCRNLDGNSHWMNGVPPECYASSFVGIPFWQLKNSFCYLPLETFQLLDGFRGHHSVFHSKVGRIHVCTIEHADTGLRLPWKAYRHCQGLSMLSEFDLQHWQWGQAPFPEIAEAFHFFPHWEAVSLLPAVLVVDLSNTTVTISYLEAFRFRKFSTVNSVTRETWASKVVGLEASVCQHASTHGHLHSCHSQISVPIDRDWNCLRRGYMTSKIRAGEKDGPLSYSTSKGKGRGHTELRHSMYHCAICTMFWNLLTISSIVQETLRSQKPFVGCIDTCTSYWPPGDSGG